MSRDVVGEFRGDMTISVVAQVKRYFKHYLDIEVRDEVHNDTIKFYHPNYPNKCLIEFSMCLSGDVSVLQFIRDKIDREAEPDSSMRCVPGYELFYPEYFKKYATT